MVPILVCSIHCTLANFFNVAFGLVSFCILCELEILFFLMVLNTKRTKAPQFKSRLGLEKPQIRRLLFRVQIESLLR